LDVGEIEFEYVNITELAQDRASMPLFMITTMVLGVQRSQEIPCVMEIIS
jgi:hypothetical protein